MWKSLIYAFVLFFFTGSKLLQGLEQPSKKTICLNMIVKDESKVITRCLSSMLPIIDYWVIVDTGSSDKTQQIIKEYMHNQGIPGELHERPWVNFEHNRNEALSLARGKGDYVFFIDADEYLVYEPDFKLPVLDKDYYYVTISHSGSRYSRILLANNHLDWKWKGILHEVLCPLSTYTYATLEKVTNIYTSDGVRSRDPQKYQKDAQILEAALKEDPNNVRYIFYLAQSYYNACNYEEALKYYEKRVEMGGWDQEVFYAMYQVGVMKELLKKPLSEVVKSYLKAFQYRPTRIEPLQQIARLYRLNGEYQLGYQTAKLAQALPVSQDVLFVHNWMYEYGISIELSICAYWIGKYEECQQICLELLKNKNLPEDIRTYAQNNLNFANAKLLEGICRKELLSQVE